MPSIHILSVDSGQATHGIRAAAEYWNAAVSVTWVGNSRQVVDVLGSEPQYDAIVIEGHGDERGLLLTELAPSIRADYPFIDLIAPNDFRSFLKLRGNMVLNLSCCGGSPSMPQALLDGGARFYIGAGGYPEGDDALMYALSFLFFYLVRNLTPPAAHGESTRFDSPGVFRCWSAQSRSGA